MKCAPRDFRRRLRRDTARHTRARSVVARDELGRGSGRFGEIGAHGSAGPLAQLPCSAHHWHQRPRSPHSFFRCAREGQIGVAVQGEQLPGSKADVQRSCFLGLLKNRSLTTLVVSMCAQRLSVRLRPQPLRSQVRARSTSR
jgi:hypothetical protein